MGFFSGIGKAIKGAVGGVAKAVGGVVKKVGGVPGLGALIGGAAAAVPGLGALVGIGAGLFKKGASAYTGAKAGGEAGMAAGTATMPDLKKPLMIAGAAAAAWYVFGRKPGRRVF